MLPQIDIEPSSACSTRKLGTVAFENAIDAEYGPSRHRAGGVPSGGGDSTEFEPATSASHVAAEKDIAYLFQKVR